jgi:hypothetical protein
MRQIACASLHSGKDCMRYCKKVYVSWALETHRIGRALYNSLAGMPTSMLEEYGSCIGRLYRTRNSWPLALLPADKRAKGHSSARERMR